MAKHERVYYHFNDLEEYHSGLWMITSGEERKEHVLAAAKLMANTAEFENAMLSALDEWPNSCVHNLTAENINRIAWLGHAGCCVAVQSPEDCTRKAWHTLTKDQQDLANAAAQTVLDKWDAAQPSTENLFGE